MVCLSFFIISIYLFCKTAFSWRLLLCSVFCKSYALIGAIHSISVSKFNVPKILMFCFVSNFDTRVRTTSHSKACGWLKAFVLLFFVWKQIT
jgi:hypothetical protein